MGRSSIFLRHMFCLDLALVMELVLSFSTIVFLKCSIKSMNIHQTFLNDINSVEETYKILKLQFLEIDVFRFFLEM